MKNIFKSGKLSIKNLKNEFQSIKNLNYQIINAVNFMNISSFNKNTISTNTQTSVSLNSLLKFNKSGFSEKLPRHKTLTLPSLSPSMDKGSIADWYKKEGDKFIAGESIAGIETDKATVDFEMTEEGYIAKIIQPKGTKGLAIGEPICITVQNKEDVAAFKNYSVSASSQEKPASKKEAEPAKEAPKETPSKSTKSNYPRHKKLKLPSLSPSMEKGKIAQWKKKEGDKFSVGDTIAGIETDKAVVDYEMTEDGYIAKILKPEGSSDVEIGSVIAIIVDNKEDIAAFKNYSLDEASSAQVSAPSKSSNEKTPSNTESSQPQSQPQGSRVFASPLAKSLATSSNIDLSKVTGTGPNNRVIKADIDEFLEKNKNTTADRVAKPVSSDTVKTSPSTSTSTSTSSSTQQGSTYKDVDVSNIRKVIADRLLQSKTTIPHYYLGAECNVDKLVDLRNKLNKVSQIKVSFNDIIIKACAIACTKVPEANSMWMGSKIRFNNQVDISVAVQTDNGLITPIVFNAHTKRLGEIAKDVKDLAAKAKEGKLKPQEFQGGTFTVSNLGMFGITSFTAIINPPQSCILAVGKIDKKVVVNEDYKEGMDKDLKYRVVNVINCMLSCDHRTVDGAVGAKWVSEFRTLMENPELMLL